ncbi:hypothetical protein [Nonomuraea sp. NPDC049141]|uniref:hypothetical protein n=1 Tax=unclassified Nonomuraea TaxID=2593643 RepID=UPI0033D35AA3
MKIIIAAAGLSLIPMFGMASTWDGSDRHEVSRSQYQVLIGQCRYADSSHARLRCRTAVRANYRVGSRDPMLDCRTYSSVTVCGTLNLSSGERACVRDSVAKHLSFRRAEVECYAFQ